MKKKIQHFRGTEKSPEMFVHTVQLLPLSLKLASLCPLNISREFSVLIRYLKYLKRWQSSSRKGKSISY